jgi:hypothetical protein
VISRLAALLLVLSSLSLAAAPLPRHRLVAEDVCGHWNARWDGLHGWVRLSPDGSWSSVLLWDREAGSLYCGTWRVEEDVLIIQERPADIDGVDYSEFRFLPEGGSRRRFVNDYGATLVLVSRVRATAVPAPKGRPR